jgi:hypothetical protein
LGLEDERGGGACIGKELGTLREVPVQLARGGAGDGVRAAQPRGSALGDEVEHDEHASGEEEEVALCRQQPWRRHGGI